MPGKPRRRALDLAVLSKVRDLSENERILVVMSLLETGLTYSDIFTIAPNLLQRSPAAESSPGSAAR